MNLKSLFAWVSGSKSTRAPRSARERPAGSRKRPTAERQLTLESLEGRDLMAIAIVYQDWKSLTFGAPLQYPEPRRPHVMEPSFADHSSQ